MSIQSVVLDVGSRFITAGFAGENSAFFFERTDKYNISGILKDANNKVIWDYSIANCDFQKLEFCLERIIYFVLTQGLLVDPKRCKIVFIESLYLPKPYKEIIARVCLFNLHCVSLTFIPSSIMTCVGSGSDCGIIVDMGYNQTTITPIFDFRILFKETRTTTRSCKLIHKYLYDEFQRLGIDTSFEFIEDFIMNSCTLEEVDDKEELEIPNGLRHKCVKDSLFNDLPGVCKDDENKTVIELIIEMIDKFPIDLKLKLASRIIFTGGISKIPGVSSFILDQLSEYKVNSIFSLGPWKGASLYLSTNSINSSTKSNKIEIHRDKYLSEEEKLIDWTDLLHI